MHLAQHVCTCCVCRCIAGCRWHHSDNILDFASLTQTHRAVTRHVIVTAILLVDPQSNKRATKAEVWRASDQVQSSRTNQGRSLGWRLTKRRRLRRRRPSWSQAAGSNFFKPRQPKAHPGGHPSPKRRPDRSWAAEPHRATPTESPCCNDLFHRRRPPEGLGACRLLRLFPALA